MPDFSTSVEIEPWEFVEQCSSSDIEDLIDSLVDGGHLDKFNGAVKSVDSHNTILNDEWFELITKIYNNRLLLSNEDEVIIKNISKKLF